MKARIGIHFRGDVVRAVMVEGGAVSAMAATEADNHAAARECLERLLELLPAPGRTPTVTIALDPPMARSKKVGDFPDIKDARTWADAIRENADRYFLGDHSTRYLAMTREEGTTRVDAYDRRLVDDLHLVLQSRGITSLTVVAAGNLTGVELDSVESEYGIALAAATLEGQRCPALEIGRARGHQRTRARAAVVCAALSFVFLLAAPILRSRHAARAASSQLASIAPRHATAARVALALKQIDDSLARVMRNRGPFTVTELLAGIAQKLPANAALLAFSYDSVKGSAVLLSASAVSTLPALDSIGLIESVRLSGPVTRERIGERDLERALILFTWRAAP